VFAGKPDMEHGNVEGKIRALYFSTSDKANYGKCVIDYRPKPVDPSGVLLDGELELKKNQLVTVVPFLGREYTISFHLYLNSYQTHDWTSVLHFTTSGDAYNYGDRNPAIWVSGHAGNPKKLHFSSGINGLINAYFYHDKIYPLKTWIQINISQILVGKKFIYKVVVNGENVLSQTNNVPVQLTNVKVYAGDYWYPAQDGKIKNLVLKTLEDGVCAKKCQK